jgi:peptidoglycan hydrolase CwlO-like protein
MAATGGRGRDSEKSAQSWRAGGEEPDVSATPSNGSGRPIDPALITRGGRKMKKLILVAVIGFLAVSAAKGTKWFSHIRSEIAEAREWAKGQVPPEREVARLRSELKLLDRDIMTVVNKLAQERVGCERLKEQVEELRARQSTAKELLHARGNAIKEAEGKSETFVSFGDRKVGLRAAKGELQDGVNRYDANQKCLDTMEATAAHRERIKDTLEKQLETLKNQKSELATQIDAMEAELTMLKLQQMESKYQTDDTRLAKIKEDLRALKTKIAVEREKLKLMPAAFDAPVSPSVGNKSVDDILAPLSGSKPAAGAKVPVIE